MYFLSSKNREYIAYLNVYGNFIVINKDINIAWESRTNNVAYVKFT